jgi:hypothetical protein
LTSDPAAAPSLLFTIGAVSVMRTSSRAGTFGAPSGMSILISRPSKSSAIDAMSTSSL